MHPSQLGVTELMNQCSLRYDRRSGPGGQHRNKTETAVVVIHQPTGLQGEASERRSQSENRDKAVFRLRLNLALNYRESCQIRRPPSDLWNRRRQGRRMVVSTSHTDFPALLAELLDYLNANEFQLAEAAEYFRVSTSQLVKLLRGYPPALTLVNEKRVQLGMGRLN